MRNYFYLCLTICFLSGKSLLGQSEDSVMTYNMNEITVKGGIEVQPKTVTEIKFKKLKISDVQNLYEISKYIPSVKFQVNSRGESLIYLRGSGSRHMSFFIDGVPQNTPWDNRIDLTLLPSNIIGNINVIKGIPSVTYGANTPAGVVNGFTINYNDLKFKRLFEASFSENYKNIGGFSLFGNSEIYGIFGAMFNDRTSFPLPNNFSNSSYSESENRINSFSRQLNLYSKLHYKFSPGHHINFSASYSESEKGVAPELDVKKPRFWQYPSIQKLALNLFGTNHFGDGKKNIISYSIAFNNQLTQINDYTDFTFSSIDDIEKDKDNTFFGRFLLSRLIGKNSILKFSASGYLNSHTEEFLTSNFAQSVYSQNLGSTGLEYEYFTESVTFIGGIGIDKSSTPKTGDKVERKSETALSFNSSIFYNYNSNLAFRINVGRKSRFPTLRELFSGALGKFVPNPLLKPEQIYSGDLGLIFTNLNLKSELSFFYSQTSDGIIRITLPESKFKRINKDNILTYGIESISNIKLNKNLNAVFNFTYMDSKAKNTAGTFSDTLEYAPGIIISSQLDYNFYGNFHSLIELNYIGDEFGLKQGSDYLQLLPNYLIANLRFSFNHSFALDIDSEFYVRVNNIFDKLYYTQWGLPEAGREIIGGLKTYF